MCVWLCRQSDKRGPPGAVIEGKAKRYKQEDGPEATQQYTAAQVRQHPGTLAVCGAGTRTEPNDVTMCACCASLCVGCAACC